MELHISTIDVIDKSPGNACLLSFFAACVTMFKMMVSTPSFCAMGDVLFAASL